MRVMINLYTHSVVCQYESNDKSLHTFSGISIWE
jgi:hypothetical protein